MSQSESAPGGGGDHELIYRGASGETTLSEVPVSVLQALYHELTGKTESLSKFFDRQVLIVYEDLRQLNFKVLQQIEQYKSIGRNVTIKVNCTDERSQTFSSWEKFSQYDQSSTAAVSEIFITYEFLVELPAVKKFHRYKLEIRLVSGVAAGNFLSPFRMGLFRITGMPAPIIVRIEYVDYLVAKNFISTIDEWVKSLAEIKSHWHFPRLQRHSGHFRHIFPSCTLAAAIYATYRLGITMNVLAVPSNPKILLWGCIGGVLMVLSTMLGRIFGMQVENHVDSTTPISAIKLTRGDERAFERRFQSNKRELLLAALFSSGAIATIFLNLVSDFILKMLT